MHIIYNIYNIYYVEIHIGLYREMYTYIYRLNIYIYYL